jgi:alpha-beta hydrolase superfamily lysophospholipase
MLGAPYTSETIDLPDDYDGPVVATLVHRPSARLEPLGAVLHVHGYCDYFFQTGMAEFYTERGYDFYAIDLRKYGRSLLPHQTPNFCLDLQEYYDDLDQAVSRIRQRVGAQKILLSGHSTGALIACLWSAARQADGEHVADAFILNSAWLDLHGSFLLRTLGTEALHRLGQRRPYAVIPRAVSGVYGETLHADHHGEWTFDWDWKPRESFPIRAGWLRAVRIGHRAVHRGIDVGAPVLSLCSTVSLSAPEWSEAAATADTVLDVKQIAKWSHQLGPDVTIIRVEGAIHDVLCSRKDVRDYAFAAIDRWLSYATTPT